MTEQKKEPTRLMAKAPPPRGVLALPQPATECLAHRCSDHQRIVMHNANGPQHSECGACIMADVDTLWKMVLDMADGYSIRLTHHAILKAKLREARTKLNLLAPGAGDYLDTDLEDEP